MPDTETKVDYIAVGDQKGGVFDTMVIPREVSEEEVVYYYENIQKGGDEVLPDF